MKIYKKRKEAQKKIIKKEKIDKKRLNIFKVNGEFKFFPLLINILIPLGLGSLVGYLNKNTVSIYNDLIKPIFAPPAIVFPIVWSILYILMGIAAYRIYMRNKQGVDDDGAYFMYIVQLIVNLAWSFIFFTFRLYAVSFLWLILLFILVVITFIKFMKVDKIAAFLLIPYLIWLLFAGALNFFIWFYNEM